MLNLKNKKILIMGCGVIGGAAAKILSESGAKIVVSDKNERALDQISLNLSDGRAIAFDASRVEKIENFFAFIQAVRVFASEGIYNAKSSIVAVSNYASLGADKGQIAYGASKAAMDNALPAIAKEIYSKGIRINSIRPAVVQSDKEPSQRERELVAMMQTGAIDPEILAKQIAFLLSESSSGVYGRHFDVRGYLV